MPCGTNSNVEATDIANWFGCFLYGNQDSCGSIQQDFCKNKIASGQGFGCELHMNGLYSTDTASFQALWSAPVDSADAVRTLAVPWGLHNGTLQGLVDEIRARGNWVVQQRKSYLRSRGLGQ